MDKDHDGSLTIEEMKSGFKDTCFQKLISGHIHKSGSEEFEVLMSKLDLDNDARIDYNEFLQAAVDHSSLLTAANIEHMF